MSALPVIVNWAELMKTAILLHQAIGSFSVMYVMSIVGKKLEKQMKKIICTDFDGVIHKCSRGYQDGEIYDEPTENARFTIENLQRAGFEVVIFTARGKEKYSKIRKWLRKYGFPPLKITNIKPKKVLAFVDDRAIRFTSWQDIVHYFI